MSCYATTVFSDLCTVHEYRKTQGYKNMKALAVEMQICSQSAATLAGALTSHRRLGSAVVMTSKRGNAAIVVVVASVAMVIATSGGVMLMVNDLCAWKRNENYMYLCPKRTKTKYCLKTEYKPEQK